MLHALRWSRTSCWAFLLGPVENRRDGKAEVPGVCGIQTWISETGWKGKRSSPLDGPTRRWRQRPPLRLAFHTRFEVKLKNSVSAEQSTRAWNAVAKILRGTFRIRLVPGQKELQRREQRLDQNDAARPRRGAPERQTFAAATGGHACTMVS